MGVLCILLGLNFIFDWIKFKFDKILWKFLDSAFRTKMKVATVRD